MNLIGEKMKSWIKCLDGSFVNTDYAVIFRPVEYREQVFEEDTLYYSERSDRIIYRIEDADLNILGYASKESAEEYLMSLYCKN